VYALRIVAGRRRTADRARLARLALELSRRGESHVLHDVLKRLGISDSEVPTMAKVAWRGRITSVQPRIRLTRSFDQSSHTYLGYALRIDGRIGDETREFWLGIGKEAHAQHRFEVGVIASGECQPVADARMEAVEYYKVSRIEVLERPAGATQNPPPWHGVPVGLPVYRERRHRRLAAVTYGKKCSSCIWGCHMPVEMIIDHWNPSVRRYRTETFCYGPKSCRFYAAGPKRVVPGRKGMRWVEEDWVDQDATSHRGDDE
jgi:hypothetical protein